MHINSNFSLSPVLYVSHGGGPLPLLGDKTHIELIDSLKYIATILEKPSAILVVSAHWQEEKATITSGKFRAFRTPIPGDSGQWLFSPFHFPLI
jgi:4,5-DOPA dioxygenase extradiol